MFAPEFCQGDIPVQDGIRIRLFGGGVEGFVIPVHRDPGSSGREAGVLPVRPLQGRPGVVPGEPVHCRHGFLLCIAFPEGEPVMVEGGYVLVFVDGFPGHIHQAQFLSLHDEGRSAHRQQQRAQRLAAGDPVGAFRQEVVDGPGLVVVLQEDRHPALGTAGHFLAGGEHLLQLGDFPFPGFAPVHLVRKVDQDMGDFKDHIHHAVLADPFRQLLRGDAVGLAHHEDIRPGRYPFLELPEEVQDTGSVGGQGVNAGQPVVRVRSSVLKHRRLFDIGDGVQPETAHAFLHPEFRHVDQGLPHLRVFPVQVRLLLQEGMEIVLSPDGIVFPGRSAEDAAPVGRGAAVLRRIPPDIPVALFVVPAGPGFHEPGVRVGGMVEHQVHHDADAPFPGFAD